MSELNVLKYPNCANIKQTSVKREWMDNTMNAHAYHCFPVSIANSIGYEISFPEEISFIWDGISDTMSDHVKVLSGEKYVSTGRANASISFDTGLVIKSDQNTTMLVMPVPNLFIDGAQTFTTLISSSFYMHPIPVVWHITRANTIITIPANQPVATILPIPLKQICDYEMNIYKAEFSDDFIKYNKEYGVEAQRVNKINGGFTDWYRNATNHKDEKIGEHELKSIKLKINDYSEKESRFVYESN